MEARQKIVMGYLGVGLAAALIAGVATWAITSNTRTNGMDSQTAEERVSELEAEVASLTAAYERASSSSESPDVAVEETGADADEDESASATAEDGRHFCFVTGIVNETGETMVTVDYAEMLTGTEANAAATAAGEESPPPNDFFIRNVNPKLRTFPVKSAIQVHLTASSGQGIDGLDVGLGEWHDSFVGMSPGYEVQHVPYWITIANGVIVDIEEQYIP